MPSLEAPHAPSAARVGAAHEIELPAAVRALSTLARVDYHDAFALRIPRAEERTAEAWARAMLEEAPASTRAALRRAWWALGVRLGSTHDRDRVLGWAVRRRAADHAVLAADSLLGMRAELVFRREADALVFATVIGLRNPLARAVWAAVAPRHRHVVRHLLERTAARTV